MLDSGLCVGWMLDGDCGFWIEDWDCGFGIGYSYSAFGVIVVIAFVKGDNSCVFVFSFFARIRDWG